MVLSPGVALAVLIMGYYSFAGFSNYFVPDSNIGGIVIRSSVLLLTIVSFMLTDRRGIPAIGAVFVPAFIFILAYCLRLFENIFLSGIDIFPGPVTIFSMLILGSIFPAFLLARMIGRVTDNQFASAGACLSVVFIGAMALNANNLGSTADVRLELDKINPISLGYTALSFLIFYLFYWRESKLLTLMAAIVTPFLLYIFIYSRSRGPYVACMAMLLAYVLQLKGTKRTWMIVAAVAAGTTVMLFGVREYMGIIFEQFERTDVNFDESTWVHYMAAVGAWQQFLDDFLIGRYAVELVTAYYPHNIYLESLMSVGLIGSTPFAIHLALAGRATVGIFRSGEFPIFAAAIATQFIVECLEGAFSGALWGDSNFWILSFAVVALWYGRPRKVNLSRFVSVSRW
jgi:hypothetical protein